MKIDTSSHLTIDEAAKSMGAPNRRSFYRAAGRAEEAGHAVIVRLFGKPLVPRAAITVLKQFYYPQGSELRSEMAKKWGASGGKKKQANARRKARA